MDFKKLLIQAATVAVVMAIVYRVPQVRGIITDNRA